MKRRIGLTRDMLEKLGATGLPISFLNWETIFFKISNDINNLPLARASSTGGTRSEWMILTPKCLLIGQNNKCSLCGPLIIEGSPSAMLDRMKAGLEIRYTKFLKQAHLFVPCPKWFRSDDVNAGDVVLFFVEPAMKSALCSCQGGERTQSHT